MLRVEIPTDKAKIKQQVKALESLLLKDSIKDRETHLEAIRVLREALKCEI